MARRAMRTRPGICGLWLAMHLISVLVEQSRCAQFEVRLSPGVSVEDVSKRGGLRLHASSGGGLIAVGADQQLMLTLKKELLLSDIEHRINKKTSADLWRKASGDGNDNGSDNAEEKVSVGFVVSGHRPDLVIAKLGNLSAAVNLDGQEGGTAVVQRKYLADTLRTLEALDDVLFVTERVKMVLFNNFAAVAVQTNTQGSTPNEQVAPLWSQGLTGRNTVLGIADTGIDFDNCFFRSQDEEASIPEERCDFSKRKIACYYVSRQGDFRDDAGGHGTHVAATAVGLHYITSSSGNPSPENLLLSKNFRNGVAPSAKIVFQDMRSSQSGDSPGLTWPSIPTLLRQAYQAYARVHSNSWGCGESRRRLCNKYDQDARYVDEFMWKHDDFLAIFAAGNSGLYSQNDMEYKDGFYTVATPSLAKNALSVGAVGSSSGGAGCSPGPCSTENVWSLSAKGSTMDGRTKPDLVAPGDRIASASSSADPSDRKHARKCSTANPQAGLEEQSGTSMSTPVIAGAALLLRQYYVEINPLSGRPEPEKGPLGDGLGPSAALLKGTLICSAQEPSGRYKIASGQVLEINDATIETKRKLFGWGLPVLSSILNYNGSLGFFVSDRRKMLTPGENTDRYVLRFLDASVVKIVLVYTDPPGPVVTRAFDTESVLVNDIDLHVECEDDGCDAGKAESRVNNVEVLIVETRSPTKLVISVVAHRVSAFDQPYALVVSSAEALSVESEPPSNYKPNWVQVPQNITGVTDEFRSSVPADFDFGMAGAVAGASLVFVLVVLSVSYVSAARVSRAYNRRHSAGGSASGS